MASQVCGKFTSTKLIGDAGSVFCCLIEYEFGMGAHEVARRLRQVRVHTAHGRMTGYVLLALPAALGIVLAYISPDHMKTLFEARMGRTMIMGAIVMQTIGFIWIRRVIKIEV